MALLGYPDYWLESLINDQWVAITPVRDLPHYYNDLEKAMVELIRVGKRAHKYTRTQIGYRIVGKRVSGAAWVENKWESVPSQTWAICG